MSERGFTDMARESAQAFRAIMSAMARPGHIIGLPATVMPPQPLMATAAAVALTLCDFQTPVWLAPSIRSVDVMRYLRFHTGAPVVEAPGAAGFAFIDAGSGLPPLDLFARGTHEYPDRSATLVIQTASLEGGRKVELSGPGLQSAAGFEPAGPDQAFWRAMAENHSGFPTGVDVIFVDLASIAAVPRSTAIHMPEGC